MFLFIYLFQTRDLRDASADRGEIVQDDQ